MKRGFQTQIMQAIFLLALVGCAQDDAAPAGVSGGISQHARSIDSAFLARIDIGKSPEPVRGFIQAASTQDLVGKPRRDYDLAFDHFDADKQDMTTFLNYFPPMSATAQRDFDQSHRDGTVIRRPVIFVRVVDGVIDNIQAYEPGL